MLSELWELLPEIEPYAPRRHEVCDVDVPGFVSEVVDYESSFIAGQDVPDVI